MTRFVPRRRMPAWAVLSALSLSILAVSTPSQTTVPERTPGNGLLSPRAFLHIPGPNPIISRGSKGSWDEYYIEAGDVIQDYETYYFYYHGVAVDLKHWNRPGYRIGVATAPHPLGPWTKSANNPLLDLGTPGTWDDVIVACPVILKEGPGKYFMWYCAVGSLPPYNRCCSIGLATASSPEGPWTKVGRGPVIEGFGYVSSVIKKEGRYYLYSEYPVNATASDYGPISLATADSPEGPWTPWNGNPVLPAGEFGAWDDGGYSEAKVVYRDGLFHIFYGGAKEYRPRRLTQESIGYAYSTDGFHFTKYGGNPVAPREASPNAAAFAEVHALFKPPFVFAFHTLRYIDPKEAMIPGGIQTEDLGVEVLVTEQAFRLPVPILQRASLQARAATKISECPPVSLNGASQASLVIEGTYEAAAKAGMRVHIRSSVDGIAYDTVDLFAFDNDFRPGTVGRKTLGFKPSAPFIKAFVENLDRAHNISQIKLTAILSGQ